MELGPHPPNRLSCPDDGPASARPVPLIPTQELALARVTVRGRRASAGHQPSSHEPGDGRLSPSTALPFVDVELADTRCWELCPDPIRSDTSCRAIAALPVGTPAPRAPPLG